jgi:hypothetical protein
MEAVLTMAPRASASFGCAARHMRIVPVRFTSSTREKLAISYSPPCRMSVPAQLTSASMRWAASTSAATEASSVTSSGCSVTPGCGGACARSPDSPAARTCQPSSASRRAIASPIPRVPPVTIAVRPSPAIRIPPFTHP